MPTATVNATELHYERRGTGEPLLLIQGMGGTHLAWGEPFLAALERAGFEPLVYDHRGVGRSARWREPFSIAGLAADAAGLLEAVGWSSAHVLGISMGGMVAQELALADPGRVRSLVLGCTYAGGPQAVLTAPAVLHAISQAMLSGDAERAIRQTYEVNVSPAFAADEANYAPFRAMATAVPVPTPVILLQMQAIGGHDTSARLAGITAPTLVIHGTEDQMLGIANGQAIAAAIPGAQLDVLDGVGHLFWWEQPQRSADLVTAHALGAATAS